MISLTRLVISTIVDSVNSIPKYFGRTKCVSSTLLTPRDGDMPRLNVSVQSSTTFKLGVNQTVSAKCSYGYHLLISTKIAQIKNHSSSGYIPRESVIRNSISSLSVSWLVWICVDLCGVVLYILYSVEVKHVIKYFKISYHFKYLIH